MSILKYAGMACDCPNCGLKPSFDWPSCYMHIRWANQYGAKISIFCEHCKTQTSIKSVNEIITIESASPIDKPLYNWKSHAWKVERLVYLESIKAKFKISYPNRPDVYEKLDEEMAYLEYHIRIGE